VLSVRESMTSGGSRARTLALIAGSLVALAGVGGYEFGHATQPARAATTAGVANSQQCLQPQDAAPISGLQP
jgi:hypothetical protein